jgi:hypothetical protein
MRRTTTGRIATLAFASVLCLTAWPGGAAAAPTPADTSSASPTPSEPTSTEPTPTEPTPTEPTPTEPTPTEPTPTEAPTTSPIDEAVVVCAPDANSSGSSAPSAPGSPGEEPPVDPCATLPPSPSVPGATSAVEDIATAFRVVTDDSTEQAQEEIVSSVPPTQTQTRDRLERRAALPRTLNKGVVSISGTGARVGLDVTVDGRNRPGRNSGSGLRDYGSKGERGVQTVLQQLPGGNLRIFKVISMHRGEPGEPTRLRFRFRTAVEVSDEYTYIGHPGVTLIDPDVTSDLLEGHRGRPIGFLSEPVALDVNSQPVKVTWTLRGRTLNIQVEDRPDIAYPVVVDPTFYPRTWMVAARNGVSLLKFVGHGVHKSAQSIVGPEVAVAMMIVGCAPRVPLTWMDTTGGFFRKVWAVVLTCLREP